jgi:hypothetical protein
MSDSWLDALNCEALEMKVVRCSCTCAESLQVWQGRGVLGLTPVIEHGRSLATLTLC